MAYEVLAPYIDIIEQGFTDKKSPRTIAKEIGQPGLYSTIGRYKTAVWNLKDMVVEAKQKRAKKFEERRDKAVDEIVNTLELINLAKLRSKQLMSTDLGEEFEISDGEKHKLTLGSASIYWSAGSKIMTDAVKLELELSGDDPESRKATAIESLSEAELDARLKELIETIDNAGSYPDG